MIKRIISNYLRLIVAIVRSFMDETVLALMATNTMIVTGFAIAFRYVEGWSFLDAFYFCVITISTVGYGEITPTTGTGRVLTVVLITIGVGLFVVFVGALADTALRNFNKNRQR